jgi:hypothetical protein
LVASHGSPGTGVAPEPSSGGTQHLATQVSVAWQSSNGWLGSSHSGGSQDAFTWDIEITKKNKIINKYLTVFI